MLGWSAARRAERGRAAEQRSRPSVTRSPLTEGDRGSRAKHPAHGRLRPRDRSGDDQSPGRSSSTVAGSVVSTGAAASTSRSSRAPAGSSTTRWRSGRNVRGGHRRRLSRRAERHPHDVAAVGITNQRETTVVWNKTHRRAGLQRDRLAGHPHAGHRRPARRRRRRHRSLRRDHVGLPLATYFAGTKIVWILENVEGARAAAEAGELLFGTTDTWVLWNLTGGADGGVHATDVTNASRTLLHGPRDPASGTTRSSRSSTCRGRCCPRSASRPRCSAPSSTRALLRGVPVAGILGDQQAATFGQAAFEAGESKNTYGTGNFLIVNTGEKIVHSGNGLLTTVGVPARRRPAALRARGVDRGDRIARPVVARQPRHHPVLRGRRDARRLGGRQRRRLHRARLLRALRALLAPGRARRPRRPHPLREQGAHRARRARVDRLPDARRDRGRQRPTPALAA